MQFHTQYKSLTLHWKSAKSLPHTRKTFPFNPTSQILTLELSKRYFLTHALTR